jgi:hypothetical protein
MMGVADTVYDSPMVESVLFRSTGVKLGGMQYGPATNPATRLYTAKGKGVGHVYMHTADQEELSGRTGPAHKSRFQDQATMVAVLVEILGTAEGKARLKWLDDNPTVAAGLWLHGATALTVLKPWYGYEQGGTALKKIKSAALNMRSHGDALFITSAYPDQFHAGLNPNAAAFVPGSV